MSYLLKEDGDKILLETGDGKLKTNNDKFQQTILQETSEETIILR